MGLPNVGKSCLFNALLKKEQAKSANYPFCTIEPNTGIVEYYDKHLYPVARILKARKVTPIPIEFVDIAGLVEGASDGMGLGNKFLEHIKRVNSILHMVRCFDTKDSDVMHVMSSVDPVRDAKIITNELKKKDIDTMQDIKGHMRKILAKGTFNPKSFERVMGDVIEILHSDKSLSSLGLTHGHPDFEILESFRLLSAKPVLFVGNIDEGSVADGGNAYTKALKEYSESVGANNVVVCAKLEFDLSVMSDENVKQEFMEMYGMKESVLDDIISLSFDLLGLGMFFTMGKSEVRAWPTEKGSTAKKCAGKIHSDFEAGFIKAEHWTVDEFIATNGTMKKTLKSADYVLKYGDCFEFKVKA